MRSLTPILFPFIPKPRSSIIFEFRAKCKGYTNVRVEMNVYYKDGMHPNMILLKNSGPYFVYISTEMKSYNIRMVTPAFDSYTKAHISIIPEDSNQVVDIEDIHIRDAPPDERIMFISSWGVRCGIASYTEDLIKNINKIIPNKTFINPIDKGTLTLDHISKLTHLQHEFGIIPTPPKIDGKVIITWHTIPKDINQTIKKFESNIDVVAHIITCNDGKKFIDTKKDLFVVSLGSTLMPTIKKEEARKLLSINIGKPIGFVFGFQSPNKNYKRLINAAINSNIHIIISGSVHQSGYEYKITNNDHVTILNRYLTDDEIDLYAIASDLLLFDYIEQEHYSSSSALHRTVGAGRPIVCTNTNHFNDIGTDIALKFNNQQELEICIEEAIANQENLGRLALDFAKKTSWEEIAKKHIELYRRYVDI